MTTRSLAPLLALAWLCGCATGASGLDAPELDAPSADRRATPDAPSDGPDAPGPDGQASPSTMPAAPSTTPVQPVQDVQDEPDLDPTATLTRVGPALAESADGTWSASAQAVAVDLRSDGWPGEAMDPTLEVRGVRFRRYLHLDPVTLRFVVAEPALVPAGEVAILRYGERIVAELPLPAVEAR